MEIKYIIISPARNEESYIRLTIQSVINQTVKPLQWIIVNDGSTDNTKSIIEEYLNSHPWIKLINLDDRGYYHPGKGIVEVFYKGLNEIKFQNWEYVVKLDCDMSFDKDYFVLLFQHFKSNPKLGIASGATYIPLNGKETPEVFQDDHPIGASKIYRRKCFEEIGGPKPIPGWDLADLLGAQMKGWETRCFGEYKLIHYRQTGVRRKGFTSGRFTLGQFQYRFGYTFIFSLLKGFSKLFEKPYIIGGMGIIFGYIFASIKKEEKLFDKEMIEFLRKRQHQFLMNKFKLRKQT